MVTTTKTRRKAPRVSAKTAQKRLGSAKKRLTRANAQRRKASTRVNAAQRSLTKARKRGKYCR